MGADQDRRRRALLARVERLPPRAWPERLALAGAGALLAGAVLPWSHDPADVDGQLGRLSGAGWVLPFLAVAVLGVVAMAAWRSPADGSSLAPVASGVAGGLAAALSFAVHDRFGDPLPVIVPGRVAVVAGGIALVVAWLGAEWRSGARSRWEWVRRAGRRRTLTDQVRVERALVELRSRPEGPPPSSRRDRAIPAGEATTWPSTPVTPVGTESADPDGTGTGPDPALDGTGTGPDPALDGTGTGPDPALDGTGTGAATDGRLRPWRTGLANAAVALFVAGAAALVGPWWRGTAGVPRTRSRYASAQAEWQVSARAMRSGIEVVGPGRSWAVALAVLVAALAVVWLGGRRAAPVVAATGAFVLAVSLADVGAWSGGATAVAVAAVLATAAAVVLAMVGAWPAVRPRALWAVPLLLAGPALLGLVVPNGDPASVPSDGPYRVLALPPEDDDQGTAAFDGSPVTRTRPNVQRAVWVDGRPGALGDPMPDAVGELALWTVEDGRAEVRHLVEQPDNIDTVVRTDYGPQVVGDLVLYDGVDGPVLLSLGDGEPRLLPPKVGWAMFGPDGAVWMRKRLDDRPYLGPIHVAPADAIEQLGDSAVEDWPFGPPVEPDAGLVMPGRDEHMLVRTSDQVTEVDSDGSVQPLLGGVPDTTCGVNRQALASDIGRHGREDDLIRDAFAPAGDGSLWVALPSPTPGDETVRLGRVDEDGTLRLVDHALPGINQIVPRPDGRAVLVLDGKRRLLELPDALDRLVDLPDPPDDCVIEEPSLAPAPALTEIELPPSDGSGGRLLLDTRGTHLTWPASLDLTLHLHTAGTRDEGVAVLEERRYVADVRVTADGTGGAWWVEPAAPPTDPVTPPTFPLDARLVHLLPGGRIDRSGPTFEVVSRDAVHSLMADGDVAHVVVGGRQLRIEGARLDVVRDDVEPMPPGSAAVTRGGDLVRHETYVQGDLVRLPGPGGGPVVPLIGGTAPDGPWRTLAVQLQEGTATDRLQLAPEGRIVADPKGDGVLLAQDGLLVRIALDGTITPLAQDPRLVGDLTILDGRLVIGSLSTIFVMEVPE